MKLITRDTDYAVRAICCIAEQKDTVVTANKLIKCLKMPKPFLRKILQMLNKEGLLKSRKGKGGGFVLCRLPKKILITDVMKIFQGPLQLNQCTFKKKICPEVRSCKLMKKLNIIEISTINQLKSITIASLLEIGR